MQTRVKRRNRQQGELRTMSIPEAGAEFYGIGETASYAAAARGEIPYIRVGGLKRVPVALMEERLRRPEPATAPDASAA
jgi:hypothetical protein